MPKNIFKTPRLKFKKWFTIIIITSILIILCIIAKIFLPYTSQNKFIQKINNELFIATTEYENKILNIIIFSPLENKIILSKDIKLDDAVYSPSSESNDSVQYNPKTKEIFFLTNGRSEMGNLCINKDGSCLSRIYKTRLDQEIKPTIILESNILPKSWAINSLDNSLIMSLVEEKKEIIKKVSGEDSEVLFIREYPIEKRINPFNLVISSDGKHTYQVFEEANSFDWSSRNLKIKKINNKSGNIEEKKIFEGEYISSTTDISPDNRYIAFYSGNQQSFKTGIFKLHIYDLLREKIINISYSGQVKNLSLFWSGDSLKLLYQLKNFPPYYYSISKSKSFPINQFSENPGYIYTWSPSNNNFVYLSQDKKIKIFDMEKNQIIETTISLELPPKFSWDQNHYEKNVEAVIWY